MTSAAPAPLRAPMPKQYRSTVGQRAALRVRLDQMKRFGRAGLKSALRPPPGVPGRKGGAPPDNQSELGRVNSLSSLCRHYRRIFERRKGRFVESLRGWTLFLTWPPYLVKRAATIFIGTARSSVAESRALSLPPLSKILTLYINLDKRQDRREQVERELKLAGIESSRRFAGITNSLGILGCTQSHLEVLGEISRLGNALTIICEDDVEFLASSLEIENLIHEFVLAPQLDVLCLSYRLRAPRIVVSKRLAIANSIQTTACYVVKEGALKGLIRSFRESEEMLLRGADPRKAALDIHWKKLQTTELLFCIPRKPVARQRPSFSDITGSVKDYGSS